MKNIELSPDYARLVQAFEAAPARTRDMVRRQVKMAVRDIREEAREHHRFITRSGMTEKSIASKVRDNEGTVYLASGIAVFQHEGTKAHTIVPRNKKVLRFAVNKNFVFTKRVQHPGIKPDPFLYNAAEKMEPVIVSRFEQALDDLLESI